MSEPMTDLEARLAAPGGDALRDQLQARLETVEADLRRRIAASVPRAEFAALAACADAAEAAQEVLREWRDLPETPLRT
jgi:hypothetical protein